jgi:hypothetical protein
VGPKAGLDTEATGNILSPLPVIEPLSPGRPTRNQTLYCLREVVSTSEKSVNFHETTRRKIPQDSYLYLLLFNKNQLFFVYYSILGTNSKSQTRHCSVFTSVLLHNSSMVALYSGSSALHSICSKPAAVLCTLGPSLRSAQCCMEYKGQHQALT